MYKLYAVKKEKSEIQGFWLDNQGKVYRDNIKIIPCKGKRALRIGIDKLFAIGEKAVFYVKGKKGFCLSNDGKLSILNNRKLLYRAKLGQAGISSLLRVYGGFTLHKLQKGLKIEVYS